LAGVGSIPAYAQTGDFVATSPVPVGGVVSGVVPPPLDVTFAVTSLVPAPGGNITGWTWDFGDEPTITNPTPITPVTHTYDTAGTYTVKLTVTFDNSGPLEIIKEDYVILTDEPAADIEITDMIADTTCLLPLNDWMPLFRVAMKSSNEEEELAFHLMESLWWEICQDQTAPDPGRPYDAIMRDAGIGWSSLDGLALPDLLEFKWVREDTLDDPAERWGVYSDDDDTIAYFAPDGTPLDGNPATFTMTPDYLNRIYRYRWDLIGGGSPQNPDYLMGTYGPGGGYRKGGQAYILLVRTSATWHHALTLSCKVTFARAVVRDTGAFPVNDEGKPIDTYTPDFYGDTVEELICSSYASSFNTWDITSTYNTDFDPTYSNAWNWPNRIYTPISEYRRPRFDVSGTAFDFVTGEYLDLRRLIPTEQFIPVIGINMHGAATLRGDPDLREVNVVFTDIGGSAVGTPGNGGFNPVQGFETLTRSYVDSSDSAVGNDFAFNGAWVWHDTNGNGQFDPPTITNPGITFIDYPMFPEEIAFIQDPDQRNPGLPQWEYIPNPPGGGDPWWKIKLRMEFGRRRPTYDTTPTGLLEPTSESFIDVGGQEAPASFVSDYFVVVRPDSGYTDTSGQPGDGVGLTLGADFRSFIEPRRFNPNFQDTGGAGHEDGGIYATPMIPADSLIAEGILVSSISWQEDPRWLADEPWWPERTLQSRNAKPVRTGAEFHNLVLNYETNNLYSYVTELEYGDSDGNYRYGLGVGSPRDASSFPPEDAIDPVTTQFDSWMDPFGLMAARFQDVHSVGVNRAVFIRSIGSVVVDDQQFGSFQWPYETVPFFSADWDLPPYGPRSSFFTAPPVQPTLIQALNWPAVLLPDEYPHEYQWAEANRRARYLKQHIEIQSSPVAMLGVNLCATDDPRVNQFARITLEQLTVAFWGPDFDPSDLQPVDVLGVNTTSGVALIEDTNRDGVFGSEGSPADPLSTDLVVQLTGLAWKTASEPIDLNGDGVADDLNSDGVVTAADNAWVLRLRPTSPWQLPVIDAPGGNVGTAAKSAIVGASSAGDSTRLATEGKALRESSKIDGALVSAITPTKVGDGYWAKTPQTVELNEDGSDPGIVSTKAIGPTGNGADDLFVIVRTSDTIKRFEQFRILIPSTLPSRTASDRQAGMQLTPQTPISTAIYQQTHPEEGPVAHYYAPDPFGYDMLEANVGVKITGLTGTGQTIVKNSPDTAVLGLDISTNRGEAVGTAAQGEVGNGAAGTFSVPGATWTAGAFTGYFLIDRQFEQYLITGNTSNTLTLESGTPRNGPFRVVRDPSFLEQLIVEFYDIGNDGKFRLADDLLPFDADPAKSGVALYRDNDYDGEEGIFDAADIPVQLDYAPFRIGQAGEPSTQVMLVFSTPGTDNVPMARAAQTRHRQWVHDSFGTGTNDDSTGNDFFVVIRTSDTLEAGDDFSVGIVSWGPNTPTEPDPDTFPPPPAARNGEFDVFSEFPWAARAVGLITFFQTEQYYKQYPELDNSGFNFVRSTVNKAEQTRTVTGVSQQGQVNDVLITTVVPNQLPKTIPGGGLNLLITGQNFGTSPTASIDGVNLTIVTSSSTSITATIPGGTTMDPDNNATATLRVTNSQNSKFGLYAAFIIGGSGGVAPSITGVSPSSGASSVFPVTITGSDFVNPKVYFGSTIMPVQSYTANQIIVSFPVGGLPTTGALNVTVQNQPSLLSTTLTNGFNYINSPGGGTGGGFGGGGGLPGGGCFIATAAYGTPFNEHLDAFRSFRDAVLLKSALGTALVDAYYTTSPAIADAVAKSPAAAWLVRLVLTPVAWVIEMPALLLMIPVVFAIGRAVRRRSRRAACAS
jgi:PKD repeat protein